MGVTYKLRQDIVDFIVQTKRSNHDLSCRGLVLVVKDKFGVDVSKSSVNAVIKQYQLSGPIGRHSIYKAPKNFSIPQDKKEGLLRNVQTFLPAVVPDKPLQLVEVPDETPVPPVPPVPPVEPEVPPVMLLPDPLAAALSPEQVNARVEEEIKSLTPLTSAPSIWLGDEGKLYGRLGAAALWFAFKSACGAIHLGEAIARSLGPLPNGVTSAQCEALFFAGLFAEHRPGFESDDLATLWRLAGLEDRQGRELLEKAAAIDADKALNSLIRTEIAMSFTPVRYFRLLTGKGGHFYIDAAAPALHHDFIDAGSSRFALPLFTAVERGVDRIITNMNPFLADAGGGLSALLLDFIRLMEGSGEDKITSLELIGDNDDRCAQFQSIPLMRRGFILRVRLSDAELARVDYEMIDNHQVFTDPVTSRSCGYYEGSLAVEGMERPLRVLTVKPEGWGDDFVLLSNISLILASSEAIISTFIRSEIAIIKGIDGSFKPYERSLDPLSSSISGKFRDIDYSANNFFLDDPVRSLSWDDRCAGLYDLAGHIKECPDAVFFRLELPENFSHQPQLTAFIHSLNRALFKTPDGRRVVFMF